MSELHISFDNAPLSCIFDTVISNEIFEITYKELMDFYENIVNKHFCLEDFSIFKKDKDILEHFYYNEDPCICEIKKFKGQKKKFYKHLLYQALQEIFTSNVKNANTIIETINQIEVENITINNFYDILTSKFNTKEIPKFLIFEKIKYINNYQFVNTFNFDILFQNKELHKNDLILYIDDLMHNKKIPFENFNNKMHLFQLFFLSNINNINNCIYIKENLLNSLSTIIEILRIQNSYLLGSEMVMAKYINISEYEVTDMLNICIDFISMEIKGNCNKMIYLIASYYHLIESLFSTNTGENNNNNIASPRKQSLFRNIVRVLIKNIKVDNIEVIINQINQLDCYNLQQNPNLFEKIKNKDYTINDIKNAIDMSRNNNVIKRFNDIIQKFPKDEMVISKIFTSIVNKLLNFPLQLPFALYNNASLNNIHLTPFIPKIYSNSVTILISGFLSEESNHFYEWKYLINDQIKSTMFYFYKWPSDSIFNLITNVFYMAKAKKSIDANSIFGNSKDKAKRCGKILASIISSETIFKNVSVNLVGFSLGCHVIKHCLKELKESGNNEDFINNVYLIGGATSFENKPKWNKIFGSVISGRVINCFSKEDYILKYLYQFFINKQPIGLEKVNYSAIENIDLTQLNIGHLDYRKKLKEIFDIINQSCFVI